MTWYLGRGRTSKCLHAPMWRTVTGALATHPRQHHHKACLRCHKVIPFGPANDTIDVQYEIAAVAVAMTWSALTGNDFGDAFQKAAEALYEAEW